MNNEIKHTAGEWEANIDHSRKAGNYPKTQISANGKLIATCYNRQDYEISQQEAEANARLIAAAPELLETLQSTFKRLEAFRNECLQEDSQEREIIIDIETDILDKIRKATRVS